MISEHLITFLCLVLIAVQVCECFEWRAMVKTLESTQEENHELQDTIFSLNKRLEKACKERDDALQDYDNLRHSWPYSEPTPQPRIPGSWPPEYWCSTKRPDLPSEGMVM